MMLKTCFICQKEIEVPKWKLNSYKNRQANRHFFCSRKCYSIFWKKEVRNKFAEIKNITKKCISCGKEFTTRWRGKNRKYRFCSRKCYQKWAIGRCIGLKGEKNNKWKGNPPRIDRTDTNYLNWRRKVKKRDKWICQICGSKNRLNAHHIFSFTDYQKLRYDTNNGMTICWECHERKYFKELHKNKSLINDPVETLPEMVLARNKSVLKRRLLLLKKRYGETQATEG